MLFIIKSFKIRNIENHLTHQILTNWIFSIGIKHKFILKTVTKCWDNTVCLHIFCNHTQ